MKRIIVALLTLFVTLSCLTPAIPDIEVVSTTVIDLQTELPVPVTQTAETTFALPSSTPILATSPAIPIQPSDTPVILNSPTAQPVTGNLLVTFIDVGQGDATLIQTAEGLTALIDGGESDSGIVAKLQQLGVTSIDIVFATHPHSDHIGGLVHVLNTMPVKRVVTNGKPHTTVSYERFLDAIFSAGAEYIEVSEGDNVPLGSINFEVLNPGRNDTSTDLNETSLVLRLQYGSASFLFMADTGNPTERRLLSSGRNIRADILKVGHHGSKSSSSAAFLNMVKPQVAVYSAGAGNSYGHPHPATITNLNAVGATVYGTDLHGNVVITANQLEYFVATTNIGQIASTIEQDATPLATATQISAPAGVEIVSVTSPVIKGSTASLTAKSQPGVMCTITVHYKSGPSKASGLEPKTTDGNGNVTWQWKVSANTASGDWRIEVSCGSKKTETYFTVK